jgi:hypothetical protein
MRISLVSFFALLVYSCNAQPNTNANQYIPPYQDGFGYGSNMGVYPPYTDESLAILAHGSPDGKVPGVGVNTIRPALPENFLQQWGYPIRLDAFKLYDSIGLKNQTVFIGFPSETNRDTIRHCNEGPSETFKGMYLDIWDDGTDGTPVNDKNTYALYVWKLATTYKGLIRYYEVMNEPDLDMKGNAWKTADMPGNWWVKNPDPCEYKLRAPIFYYVRMLRISYEVIKSVDPRAYVAIGGIGYTSFLDAVCRNTDNPNQGTLTSKFPFKGGAYFDVLSYHSYPHIDNSLREWDIPSAQFRYFRNSDMALDGTWKQRDAMRMVLNQHGYNGTTYPKKRWIITEINIPRKQYGYFIGSDAAQTNFMMKALIEGQIEGVDAMYIYNMGDEVKEKDATNEFNFMGLFKNMSGEQLYQATKNQMAFGFKTTSDILNGFRYDSISTKALKLPVNVRGGAFSNGTGRTIYALWVRTEGDLNEFSTLQFKFPTAAKYLYQKQWDFSETGVSVLVNALDVTLSATPSFLEVAPDNDADFPKTLKVFPNPIADSNQCALSFYLYEEQTIDLDVYDNKGRLIQSLAQQRLFPKGGHQLVVNLTQQAKGTYFVRLKTAGNVQTIPLIRM